MGRSSRSLFRNYLLWGQSSLVNSAEWPKIGVLNRSFGLLGTFGWVFLVKAAKHRVLNILQSRVRKLTRCKLSGLACFASNTRLERCHPKILGVGSSLQTFSKHSAHLQCYFHALFPSPFPGINSPIQSGMSV